MRASPAFHVNIKHYGLWRAGVASLIAVTSAAVIAWLLSRNNPLAFVLGVAATGTAAAGMAATLLRCPPMSLRWDTQQWHLGPESSVGEEPWTGRLAVAVDVSGWMLLRFDHDAPVNRRRTTWLPIQRLGLEAQWHALRCAVYCARPDPGHDAA